MQALRKLGAGLPARIGRLATSPVWSELSRPARISVGWYVHAWLDRFGAGSSREVSRGAPSIALAAQTALDETVLSVVRLTHRMPDAGELERIVAEERVAIALYAANGWLDDPASYHVEPPSIPEPSMRAARSGALRYTVMSFDSGYAPHEGEPGRARWLADVANRTAYAWLLRHDEPRPWIVCVHGAAMGQPSADLRVFRAAWLHSVLGLNVAMPIQARHGPRRAGLPIGVGFPDQDVMDNVHAIAQSVWDIRRLLRWIRETDPGEPVGLQGISLGGYTVALLAGLEDDLAFVIAGVPVVDIVNLLERHAPSHYRSQPNVDRITTLAAEVQRVVSPLAFEPRVPHDRLFIYAGVADRLVSPVHQVQHLWRHWERPTIDWFEGSHVGFFLSRPVRDFVVSALRTSGVLGHEEGTLAPPGPSPRGASSA